MGLQDANGRWGSSETPCQTLALQGQNCNKFYVVQSQMKEQQLLCTARTLHCIAVTFKPYASTETVIVVGALVSHKAWFVLSLSLFFLEDIIHNYWAKKIPVDIWLNRDWHSEPFLWSIQS